MKSCIITVKDRSFLEGSFLKKIEGVISFNYVNMATKPCVGEDILVCAKDINSESKTSTFISTIKYILNQPKNLEITEDFPSFCREDIDFYIFIVGNKEICNLEKNISF